MKTIATGKSLEEHRPLKLAVHSGAVDAALYLIELGASIKDTEINEDDEDGSYDNEPLSHLLGRNVRIEAHKSGQQLIDEIITNETPNLGPALLSACKAGVSIAVVKKLLSAGADVSYISTEGDTPLSAACTSHLFGNNLDIFKQLITDDSINKSNDNSDTPLVNALKTTNVKVIRSLLDRGAKQVDCDIDTLLTALCKSPFHSEEGVSLAKDLLTKDQVNPKGTDEHPMIMAIREGSVGLIKVLISLGSNPEHGIDDEEHFISPLIEASENEMFDNSEYREIIELLATKKLINYSPSSDGKTAVHTAAYYGYLNFTKMLLELGADPTTLDSEGSNILHSAATEEIWCSSEGISVISRMLNSHPGLIDVQDSSGEYVFFSLSFFFFFFSLL